jgi:hypothetical protein
MHRSIQHFLRFTNGGEAYQFYALHFGSNVSAWAFTKATSVAVSFLHTEGIAVSAFMDDWIIHHLSQQVAAVHRAGTIRCLLELGWLVHENKSVFTPSQRFRFLGVLVATTTITMALPVERLTRFVLCCCPSGWDPVWLLCRKPRGTTAAARARTPEEEDPVSEPTNKASPALKKFC